MAPKLCDFLFLLFLPEFEKILAKSFGQGELLQSFFIFQTTAHEKIETWKFFFLLKMAEIRREYNFRSDKSFLTIKSDFGNIKYEFRGKHRNKRNESFPCEKTNFMTSYL